MPEATLLTGNALDLLPTLPDASVRCCVTSPPYWGLRDYGVEGQLGLERTPEEYVARMVAVFREVRRVLADDGTLWLNLGDSYAVSGCGGNPEGSEHIKQRTNRGSQGVTGLRADRRFTASIAAHKGAGGLKPKDLVGIPWRVAFALQADGWYLRSDIIWSKPNPMPESVTDRPTKAHEYLFLLAKSERYYFDADAIAEPVVKGDAGSTFTEGKTGVNGAGRQQSAESRQRKQDQVGKPQYTGFNARWDASDGDQRPTRNARSVWTIATQPYPEAHFATFPEELARRCIVAGSAPGDTVLDPFSGSGTVAAVAVGNGRKAIGIELNPAYQAMAERRVGPMFVVGRAAS